MVSQKGVYYTNDKSVAQSINIFEPARFFGLWDSVARLGDARLEKAFRWLNFPSRGSCSKIPG